MFEPFTQGETFESRKQGGTGLGLAITKQLVTLLDGEISVTSKLGSGSKFWFDVPLKVEKKAAPPEARWQSGAKNVLVLQGEWSGARVVARMLEEAGSEVTTLREAYTALDTLVTENFDLIVVDEILPDMNGYEFIERLRSSDKSKTMGIVLMTSTRPAAVKLDRVSAADARVSRPVRRSRLREAVDQALGRAPAPAPVADEPATGVPAQKAAEHGGASKTAEKPHRGLRVLLVEDSPVNREVATGMLESLGCIVDTASDGNVGLEEALSWRFDVILMDCQMPRMDGFEATSRIRKAEAAVGRAGMPIIAVTANALQGDRERCLAAGMTDFVSKPYTIKKLSDALTAAKTGKTNFEVPPPNPRIKSAVQKDLPVVDSSHIDELRSIGKPGLLEGAIELFHKQAGAVLGEIDAALRGDDAALAEARFHALKSCSLSVGARRFADLAGQCELAARKGDLAAARALSAGLRPEYATLSEALVAVSQEIRLAI
jgi:CheY-like chemotaxis protein